MEYIECFVLIEHNRQSLVVSVGYKVCSNFCDTLIVQ